MGLFSRRRESECLLVFDVGSGSVGGAIVLASAVGPARVLYSFRSDIPFQEEARGAQLLALMLRALSQVVSDIHREGFDASGFGSHRPRITEAVVSLSAPWIASRTSFLRLKNQAPALISPEIVASLIEHARSNRDAKKEVPTGAVPVEQKLVKSALNGYETARPYGKEAREAEFAVCESFVLPGIVEKITDTITRVVHPHRMSIHSFSLAAFAVLRELLPHEPHFVLVDVSGEQTELSIVKNATLVESATFPFGRQRLIRMLRRAAHIPVSSIETFLKLYREEKGTGRLFERAKHTMERVQEEWGVELERALGAFSEELFLPPLLYLMADDDVASVFARAALTRDAGRFTLSSVSFHATVVDSDMLAPLVSWSPPHARDPFLGMLAAFAGRIRR